MNRPLSRLERSGAAVRDYWPVGIPPMPAPQAGLVVAPSTSITRAISDVATIAQEHGLVVSFSHSGRWDTSADTDAFQSFVLPKKVSRLKVITHQRGKGTFLPYD
jgi:hypothetical protein